MKRRKYIYISLLASYVASSRDFFCALNVTIDFNAWIVDFGVSNHIRIDDGTYSKIVGIGYVFISKYLISENVLHASDLKCNMLSISKLTLMKYYIVIFNSQQCMFQDLNLGKMIGSAKEYSGLYVWNISRHQVRELGVNKSIFVASNNNYDSRKMLWHNRLGHPNLMYLKRIFPNIFSKSS